jgi:Clostripain family
MENVTETTQAKEAREAKEWTVMFYFASDNPLAPGIVSQLKAIKEAGFHVDANVIAQFDPHTQNTPPHVFDVNLAYRLKARGRSQVGFGSNDPYVRSLVTDKLWGEKDESIKARIKDSLNARRHRPGEPEIDYNPPSPSKEMFQEQNPKEALESFLDFCKREYPAHHYMLFILGHGLVVGNDLFLYDENTPRQAQVPRAEVVLRAHPAENGNGKAKVLDKESLPSEHSLLLKDLGAALDKFTDGNKGVLELVSFHSCSMSSLEVAYQLQDKAKYMLASQGPAFVGSWPYRQILIRLFNDLESSEIAEDDLFGAAALVNELNNPTTEVSRYLSSKFDPSTVNKLAEYNGSSELKREILIELLKALNSVLADPNLYIDNKDKVKWLSEATRRQFSVVSQQQNGQHPDKGLKRLNRLILTDAYPDMIAKVSVKKMLTRMYYYCLYNSYDFQLAGYSFDLCLCDLSKIEGITKPLSSLSEKLQEGLRDLTTPMVQQLILLAHWDAQSFWQESYTDLYDFCFRLKCRCDDAIQTLKGVSNSENELNRLKDISDASDEVMLALKRGVRGDDDRMIVRSEFAGAAYQYSHGLSVYFPWSRPVDSFFSDQYKDYKFKDTGWSGFLETYFDITRRKPRLAEVDPLGSVIAMSGVEQELLELLQDISTRVYNNDGQLSSKGGGNDPTGSKGGGNDPSGDDCNCPTIKNYPSFIRTPPAVIPVGGAPIAAAIEQAVPEGNGVSTKEVRLSPDFTLGV